MKPIFKLLILSTLCMLIWLGEVLVRSWSGLQWLNYFHLAWLIIALILVQLVSRAESQLTPRKHLFVYPALMLGYLIPIVIIFITLSDKQSSFYVHKLHSYSLAMAYSILLFIVAVFGTTTFLFNLIIARIEKVKLSIKHKLILFFHHI